MKKDIHKSPLHAKSSFYVKTTENSESIEFVENFEMTNDFKQKVCLPYFKDVYKDLVLRSDQEDKGIDKTTFLQYIKVPGIIGNRLFAVFDHNQDNYLDLMEFSVGILKLYSSEFSIKSKLIFDLYDFDKDGYITRDDVVLLLSHSPIASPTESAKEESEGQLTLEESKGANYKDRVESQKELFDLVDLCFGKKTMAFFIVFPSIR